MHHGVHLLDHLESVEFKQYLQRLCEDLSALLFQGETAHTIAVEGARIDIPTVFAIPLGFIVNELITNSAKYAKSNITVRLETEPTVGHSLSVLDDGPGLPAGFDPSASKWSRNGESWCRFAGEADRQERLQVAPGENDRGARFTVTFSSPRLGINGT